MRDERWVVGRPRHGTREYDAELRLHNVHSTVDDHSRLAYSEIHADERAETCPAFLRRAVAFYAAHGIRVERLLTDNAKMYRCSHVFRATAAELAQTAVHPSAPAPDQRKGRALQPDPPRGVGLRPALSIKRRPAPLAVSPGPPVQPSPVPHGVEGRTADLPCQQPGREPQRAQGIPRAAMSPAASYGRTVEPVTEEDF
jgi:hypothetical protein